MRNLVLHYFHTITRTPLQSSRSSSTIFCTSLAMRMRKKHDLPQKTCAQCGLPFAWRKKWEAVWDEVKYCSDRCRNERKRSAPQAATTPGTPAAVTPLSKPRRSA